MKLLILIIIIIILFNIYYYNFNKYEYFNTYNKIAFIFLIYDEINHEHIWQLFFKSIDTDKYNIYIHYKIYKPSSFFDKYKLNNIIPTEWCGISLVQAHNLLLKEALKDQNNTNFILLSNSCIPFKTFDYIYNNLFINYSYFNLMLLKNFDNCILALSNINKNLIRKNHQWSILNRKHALLLVNDESKYINWFYNCSVCADEYAHINYLIYSKLDNEIIITNNEKEKATTFTNWNSEQSVLNNYNNITNNEIIFLINSPCFFGRKFNKNCKNLDLLRKYLSYY